MTHDEEIYQKGYKDGFFQGLRDPLDKAKVLYKEWLKNPTRVPFEAWLDQIGEDYE